MAEKMLIDASHPEETRVVVVRGNRIEEFDFESQHKKQLRGNIYLAKVTRVEPSLQAAFVDYGGNRHGFLAFSEIHPDYYQIPLADRQALLQAEAEEARNDPDFESADEDEKPARKTEKRDADKNGRRAAEAEKPEEAKAEEGKAETGKRPRRSRRKRKDEVEAAAAEDAETQQDADAADANEAPEAAEAGNEEAASDADGEDGEDTPTTMAAEIEADEISEPVARAKKGQKRDEDGGEGPSEVASDENVESVGAEDALEELPTRSTFKPRRQYRIQEVIKRRQILLVQVVKEERGNKGAALTTYLSLAGRYSVLMPNTARGGGISRKITNLADRKRLKEIARELEVPQGMGVILRTAGANRTKVEIKRDFEYLMRLWDNVRTLTLKSTAPALVYEEGSLIKRSIRDLYNKDISEIIVSGEEGYREAKDFMKMLMPSHAKVVQPYRDLMPIFARSGIDAQLDRMLQPQVTLKSGGYIIINQTEALVAIDVNSGRSTREHSIEDTALQTNLEAAEEVARQLRLRDLAGLIVIDFIDMEENRNNRAVEKRIKECLKHDRARIQVGRISHFGLLEMSRQRIRASVLESTMQVCPHCGGAGHVRSQSSVALHVLRGIEEYLLKNTTHHITVKTTADTALYMLNHKRDTIVDLEKRFGLSITFSADASIGTQHFAIERGAAVENPVTLAHITASGPNYAEDEDDDVPVIEEDEEEAPVAAREGNGEGEEREDGRGGRKRRRRRRRGRRQDGDGEARQAESGSQSGDEDADDDGDEDEGDAGDGAEASASATAEGGEQRNGKRRRRGKRGGRRNREEREEDRTAEASEDAGPDDESDAQSADDAEVTAEVVAEEAAVVAEAPATEEEVPAEKPKRTRRSRAKKADAETVSEAAPEVDVAATATAPVVEEAPVEETPTEETPAEVAAEETSAAETPAADAPRRDRRAQTDLSAIASAPVVTSSNGEKSEGEKPKKAGWWQKRGFL